MKAGLEFSVVKRQPSLLLAEEGNHVCALFLPSFTHGHGMAFPEYIYIL